MSHEELEIADRALLERTAQGDRGAFALLVQRHQRAVYRWAKACAPDEASAQDILQETFLEAWRGATSFQGQGSARAWLLGIARHQAARHRRKRSAQALPQDSLEALGQRAGWGEPSPEAQAITQERLRRLRAALEALPPQDREILLLRDLEGLTGPEAAQVLGLELSTTKTRLHRARLRLMAALRQGGTHGP